ncbi:HAD family hydrolase [Alteribacillus sp. HJP-4]|uniref:HAD family hydrolase n=1 Tax=Alteribacillus sp. HJP-4 TaxID=2775394 RepID=UPI0035CCCD04
MNVVAIDMDGTLLHSDGYISEKNTLALRKLQEQGNKLVIATGRGISDVHRLLGEVDITPDGIVALNGAIISWEGNIIKESHMKRDSAVSLIQWLEENKYYYQIYTNDGLYSPPRSREYFMNDLNIYTSDKEDGDAINEAVRRRADGHWRQAQMKKLHHSDQIEEKQLNVYKFLIISMLEDKLTSCRMQWNEKENIFITSSGRDNLEIMHPSIQKGNGLLYLVRHADLSIESTYAIGDNYNDLPMFNAAKYSIAMGNAEEDVKRVASCETKVNDEDGVAHAIESIILPSSAPVR